MPSNKQGKSRVGAQAPARWVIGFTDTLAAIGLLTMMGIAFFDVVGRTFFASPMPGATELTELAVAATVACILPSLAYKGLHATIDVLDFLVPDRVRPYQLAFADILSAVAVAFVAWRVWIEGDKTARFGGETPLLEIPMAPVLYGCAIAFAIAALASVLSVFKAFSGDDS